MRVRYGKPIKAKSLLGQANIPFSYTAANITFYPLTTGTFHYYAGPSVLNIKYVNRQANHKYFLFLNTEIVYSWAYFGIWDTYNTGYEGNRTAPIKDGNNYYALISPTTSATNGVPTFQFGVTQNLPAIANYALIIDLTEIGLDNLTAQEFYNKYHQCFPLIAAGEEITIDDKAGQIPLKKSLPDEYQEVEYVSIINNSSNDYRNGILTSIAWNSVNKIKVDLQVINYSTGYPSITNQNILLRSGVSNSAAAPWINIRNDSTPTYSGLDSFSYSTPYDSSLLLTRHQTLTFTFVSSSTNNIYVGSWQDNAYSGSNNLYEITFYNNDTIIGKLIPCYRKSDNVIGMYDLVGKQFYVNQGTGAFLKGPNVSNVISCKIAGGSSDIYYGYNNLCMPLVQDYFYSEYNTEPTAARTYDESNNSTTYMANGSNKNFRLLSTDKNILSVFEGHHYYVRAKMSWNCSNAVITKMGNLNVLTSPGFNIVDSGKPVTNNAYFENIHISKRTGSARWVWSPIIDSGTIQDGDTFTTSDFEIIDLTDWFGPGKEPSTVEEFREKFTKEYYGFCKTPIKLTRYQIEASPSYGYNQLLNNPTFVLSCTTSQVSGKAVGTVDFVANNKYLIRCYQDKTMTSNTRNTFLVYLNGSPTYENPTENYNLNSGNRGWIYTPSESGTGNIQLWAHTPSVDVKYSDFQVINLTDWYGAGSEPTTVEEFKATFPNKYYPYSKKRLLNKYMINKLIN